MQHTTKWKMTPLVFALGLAFSTASFVSHADENSEKKKDESEVNVSEQDESCFISCDLSGSVSTSYSSSLHDKDDHRAVRTLSWSGSLNYALLERTRISFSTGGYRTFENKTGTFATDSVIGVSQSKIFAFGETGSVSVSGQFTIPTSESSQKNDLTTAFRLAVPVSAKAFGINWSVTPRIRKNFHSYVADSDTEWVYSLGSSASKSFGDLSVGISALGGNTISYAGTRRDNFSYNGSIYASYRIADSVSASFSAATAGMYADAERGTLGDIDVFDANKATVTASVSYSF